MPEVVPLVVAALDADALVGEVLGVAALADVGDTPRAVPELVAAASDVADTMLSAFAAPAILTPATPRTATVSTPRRAPPPGPFGPRAAVSVIGSVTVGSWGLVAALVPVTRRCVGLRDRDLDGA